MYDLNIFSTSTHEILTYYDFLLTTFLMLAGLIAATKIGRLFSVSDKAGFFLYVWHLFFCLVYIVYMLFLGGDALTYYEAALAGKTSFSVGTRFVVVFSELFIRLLDFSFLNVFLVFNFFGYIGLLCFYAVLNEVAEANQRRWLPLLAFLPSISFWSAALGKDSLAFMATGLALWAALNIKKRTLAIIISIAMMTLVRPHIGAIMAIAYALSIITDKSITLMPRIILGLFGLVAVMGLVPFALQYAGLENVSSMQDIDSYVSDRQRNNMTGGGGIDISNMNTPMKLFTYLLRPLPFEAFSMLSLMAAFENLLLLTALGSGLYYKIKNKPPVVEANRVFMWSYAIITWLVLSSSTSNLGIASRQKWMFLPMLLFVLVSLIPKAAPRVKTIKYKMTRYHAAQAQMLTRNK